MANFIAHLLVYVNSLSDDVHLLKHLRKSSKMDFRFLVPRKFTRVRYHWKCFLKLYTLIYSDSSFIRWAQKSKKSRNSAYLYPSISKLNKDLNTGPNFCRNIFEIKNILEKEYNHSYNVIALTGI